jgi:hypothetical protein
MNSKMNMLIPARTMSDILIQNVAFTKYSVADCEQDQTWPPQGAMLLLGLLHDPLVYGSRENIQIGTREEGIA